MAVDDDPGTGYKILAGLAAVAAGTLARRALTSSWSKVAGSEPPMNPESPDVTWAEAAAWAVVSGAAVGLARLVAQRQVAASWRRATGESISRSSSA